MFYKYLKLPYSIVTYSGLRIFEYTLYKHKRCMNKINTAAYKIESS